MSGPRMPFRFGDLVGRYRLVVSPELLGFVERAFVESAPVEQRDAVRAEALAEATAAEFELTPDGFAISRAGAQEFYRVELPMNDDLHEELRFRKPDGGEVILTLGAPGELVAHQPGTGKPPAAFRRVR